MGHASDPDELFEVLGNELGAIVGDDPGGRLRKLFHGSLKNDFNVFFGHSFSQFPMDDVPTAAVKDAAQIVKSATQVDVRDVYMPVLMRFEGLHKACTFFGCFTVPAAEQFSSTQDTINATGADGNNISIEHHEGQSAIAFQRMLEIEIDNGLLLPIFQPEVAGNQSVVFIDLAISALPVVILTGRNTQPSDKMRHCDAGAFGPAFNEIDHGIANIVRYPRRF